MFFLIFFYSNYYEAWIAQARFGSAKKTKADSQHWLPVLGAKKKTLRKNSMNDNRKKLRICRTYPVSFLNNKFRDV